MSMNKKFRIFSFPNIITLLNLLSGSIALLLAITDFTLLPWATAFILFAAIFDFLDGFTARLLHSYSKIGEQLDSLADLVSFGMAPGAVSLSILNKQLFGDIRIVPETILSSPESLLMLTAFLIPAFSALRLAKFNIDTRQKESFLGLPTPANAIGIASLALIISNPAGTLHSLVNTPLCIISVNILFSVLLITEIPMFSLKFKHFRFRGNENRYIFLFLSLIGIILFQIESIPVIIVLYILFSVILLLLKTKKSGN